MTHTEIRELRDKLEPLSFAIGGIQVKFPFQTDELCLTAFPSTQECLEQMHRLLEPYRKRFLCIDLQLQPDPSLCWKFLQRIDFFHFQAVLVPALRAEIDALLHRAKPDPLYAFVLGVSPEHHGVTIFWNTPDNWSAREAYYAANDHPAHPSTKYNGPDFLCEPLSGNHAVWKPVWDALASHDQACGEFYDLTSGGGIFFNIYENRFRDIAARALREVIPDLEALPRTTDFVAYVQDCVGGGDDLFLALETVPQKRLKEVMPWLFQSTNGDADQKA